MSRQSPAVAGTLNVRGVEYVVIPKADYLRMQGGAAPRAGSVDAHAFVRQTLGGELRAAREHAKLTQAELAEKLGKSQTMISQAESGEARISERYVRTVLKACKLPADWTPPKPKTSKTRAQK
ncbi:MAG TPA: helix-turn-helix transcriptional regulator [Polyangiaceae bacterium]